MTRFSRGRLSRVQQIAKKETGEASSIERKAVAGLVTGAEDMVKDTVDESVRDAALISTKPSELSTMK
jgi:ferritin-like metal-binding protein YciE